MSIDAVAVLRIARLEPLAAPYGCHPVAHSGDASLVNTMTPFHGVTADELALSLRRLLGEALDAHDDPRGILLFPDAAAPSSAGYEAIVKEMAGAGKWVPKVGPDHIPARYTSSGKATEPHDLLVGQLIGVLGRDAALELDMIAQAAQLNKLVAPERDSREFEEQIATVARLMGDEFAARYAASLRGKADALMHAANAWHGGFMR